MALARSKTPNALIFDVTQQQVASDVELSCRRLLVLAEVSVVMYMFRHAGASMDFARKVRPLAEIKLRGRWKGDQSLRRYEKGDRLAKQLDRLPAPLRNHVVRCAACVNVLAGSVSALPAP